jgi:hypothetical protein
LQLNFLSHSSSSSEYGTLSTILRGTTATLFKSFELEDVNSNPLRVLEWNAAWRMLEMRAPGFELNHSSKGAMPPSALLVVVSSCVAVD